MANICVSCKKDISSGKNSTKFICPECGKNEIIRCGNCRKLSTKYKCEECGSEGP